jgi:hypothetical protein
MSKGSKSPTSTGNKGLPPNMPGKSKGNKSPTSTGNKGVPPFKGPGSRKAPRD